MMSAAEVRICETSGCSAKASLQCPTCIKIGIPGSYFCSQDCFKGGWNEHKVLHKIAKGESRTTTDGNSYAPWPGYSYTGQLRPYPQSVLRTVPPSIARPDYADHPSGISQSEVALRGATSIKILDDEEIEGMRVACKLGREVLEAAVAVAAVGVTTDEIDRVVHEACIERDCYPSPLNYNGFPKSCCTSINEVICHGIPDTRPLKDGDICNVDVTVYHRGFHGDLNETLLIGNVSESARKLTQNTWECLQKSIELVRPGEKYREVGNVIQKHALGGGFSVVKSYTGHGIHRLFHTAPNIPHYAKNRAWGVMKAGHCFTIEPMINAGTWRDTTWPDRWTAVTTDGQLTAQFEETLLVTDKGVEVLTRRRTRDNPYFQDP